MEDRPEVLADPLAWWLDQQVALVIGTSVVRGWVMTAAAHPASTDDGAPIGHLTIVPFVGSQTLARQYPSAVTVAVHAGGPHGRPHRVLGLWTESDLNDVRPHLGSTRSSLEKTQVIRTAGQLTRTWTTST